MADNFKRSVMVFHENSITTGVGEVYPISEMSSTLNIEFATDDIFSAKIEVQMINHSKWYPWPVIVMKPNPGIADGLITDAGYIYSIETIGISAVRVNVISVDGPLSVYGLEVG